MSDWVLLLPPSESKASPPGSGMLFQNAFKQKKTNSFSDLNPRRRILFDALQDVLRRPHGLEKIFEVRGEALDEAIRANRNFEEARTLPAREMYTGIMYQAIDFGTLKKAEVKLFDNQTLIVSGLFGLLRPNDRIPPYKLKISANLGGAVGRLAIYWREPVSTILRQELKGKVVWDFLPDQHRRVWDSTGETRAVYGVKFVKRVVRDGVAEWKTISHYSKALKGALVRHLLRKDAMSPKDLKDFVHSEGYRYEPSLSVEGKRTAVLAFAAE